MMVVAALCEGQASKVADIKEPIHDVLTLAMRRAAALGGPLPGEKLSALLKSDCWTGLLELGEEDRQFHRLPRGRRPLNDPRSKMLELLDQAASALLTGDGPQGVCEHREREHAMAYDIDVAVERFTVEAGHRKRVGNTPAQARDLETILTILEVAAISLTNVAGATFTRERLIKEARSIGGDEIDLREEDIDIVLHKQSFLKKSGKELSLR
jgi:hypothetical protein